MQEVRFIGLDVHRDSITIAVADGDTISAHAGTFTESDGGCGCRTARSRGATSSCAFWLLAVAAATLRRGRRQFKRSGSTASSGAG